MAFNILRHNSGCASGDQIKRSRLRDIVEVCDTLKGSHDKVEGILFDCSQKVDLQVRADTFNRMTKLRYLKLYAPLGKKRLATMSVPEDIMPFSDKLRYFKWNGYPLKSLPQPFFARLLVEIHLPHSNVEYLWHDAQELDKLEVNDLSECKLLIKLPDLSAAPKLKRLYLSGCESLCEVQPSVFSKDTLVTLLLDRCTKLQSLISEKHLTSLQKLNVDGCISLKEFSLFSSLIDWLNLRNTGIEILHPSIGGMNKLESLNLEGLMLQGLPREMSHLCSLTQLRLSKCSIVTTSQLEAIFDGDGLKSLKLLHLQYCCNLFELPSNISSLASLCELRLDGSNVRMLPTSIKELLKLEILSLDNCIELCCLPELPPHIQVLRADNCNSLQTVFTLKSFSTRMAGGMKYISFKNCSKMELDGQSLNWNKEDAILMMKIAAYRNIEVRKSPGSQGYIHNSAAVCFPGSIVPRQFEYISHGSSSETIEIDYSNLLGFILSIVVSPLHKMKGSDNENDGIECQCYSSDGSKVGYASMVHMKGISNLNMDHVFVWYNPYHSNRINYSCIPGRKFSFEFCIMAETQGEKLDNLLSIKECGIFPIYCSEFPMLLDSVNLDNVSTSKLYEDGVQLKLESDESYLEKEEDNGIKLIEVDDEVDKVGTSTHIKNQDLDLNEKSHHLYDSSIGTHVTDNTREKEILNEDGKGWFTSDKWSNFFPTIWKWSNFFYSTIGKWILTTKNRKSQEEIETSSQKQEQLEEGDYTGGSKDAKSSFKKTTMLKSKGNEEIPTESVAGLHLPIVCVDEENASANKSSENIYGKQDSFEDTKHYSVEGNSNLQEERPVIPKGEEQPYAELYNTQCIAEELMDTLFGNTEVQRGIEDALHDPGNSDELKLYLRDFLEEMALTKETLHDMFGVWEETEMGRKPELYSKKTEESMEKARSECEDEAMRLREKLNYRIKNLNSCC